MRLKLTCIFSFIFQLLLCVFSRSLKIEEKVNYSKSFNCFALFSYYCCCVALCWVEYCQDSSNHVNCDLITIFDLNNNKLIKKKTHIFVLALKYTRNHIENQSENNKKEKVKWKKNERERERERKRDTHSK